MQDVVQIRLEESDGAIVFFDEVEVVYDFDTPEKILNLRSKEMPNNPARKRIRLDCRLTG